LRISEKTRRSLQEFGLTDYEMRAYIALLETGPTTADKLSEESDVPYSKVHNVLSSLEKKGWVEMEHSRPGRYYPKPPSVAIDTTKLQVESRLRSSQAVVLEELQPLYERRGVREHPDVWIVRGEANILTKIRETLENSKKEILIAFPAIPDTAIDILLPTIKAVSGRGIKIQVMTTEKVRTSSLDKLGRVCDVRVREQMFGGGIIADGREVMLLLGEEEEPRVFLAIWSDHIGLAKFAKNYFDNLWQESQALPEPRE
jgi:sugar-specific transcriptional regulator TrmB